MKSVKPHSRKSWERIAEDEALRRESRDAFDSHCRRLSDNDPSLVAVNVHDRIVWSRGTVEDLAEALAYNMHLRSLSFCLSQSMTADALDSLAKTIVPNPANQYRQLTRLEVRGSNDTPTPLKHRVFELVRLLPELQELRLTFPLLSDDVQFLCQAVRDNTIPKIWLCISSHDHVWQYAKVLEEIISMSQFVELSRLNQLYQSTQRDVYRNGVQRSENVRSLTIDNGMPNDIGDLINALRPLHSFIIHKWNATGRFDTTMREFSAGLHAATNLTVLHISSGSLDDAHTLLLAQGLRHNHQTLKLLNLEQNNYIGDGGIEALIHFWPEDSSLKTLLLGNNRIGIQGARQLLQAVATHPAMGHIDLSHNLPIGFAGLVELAQEIVPNVQLHTLGLAGCGRLTHDDATNAEPQQRVDRQRFSRAMLDAVPQNPHLRELLLNDDDVEPMAVNAGLQFLLLTRRNGLYLLSTDHGLGNAIWCHVLAKCKANASLVYFFLREQPDLAAAY